VVRVIEMVYGERRSVGEVLEFLSTSSCVPNLEA
jgi:hypothetical protein